LKIEREEDTVLSSGSRREQKVARKMEPALYSSMHSSAFFSPAYQSVRHVAADSQGAKEPLGCMRTVLVASLRLAGDM
jgi:hypothetical protein